jgi:hypothetical protein
MAWLISTFVERLTESIAVGLSYSFEHRAFMVQNLADYSWAAEELHGFGPLRDRAEIVGTELATVVFALADEIWLCDENVIEFVQASIESHTCDD